MSICIAICVTGIALIMCATMAAESSATTGKGAVTDKVLELVKERDSFAGIEYILGLGEDAAVAKVFAEVMCELHSKKAIAAEIAIGRAGIQYCLTIGQTLRDKDLKRSIAMREMARQISYNLAANLWPGWAEEGVVLGSGDLATGLELAKLDLRLIEETESPPKKRSNGHWLIGAQLIAAGQYMEALSHLESARQYADKAADTDHLNMIKGYIGLAEILGKRPEGKQHFDSAVAELSKSQGEDGKFFADQLRTASKVFAKPIP